MTVKADTSSPGRFACALTLADEPACEKYARVTITDAEGGRARACPQHATRALEGITGAVVDWADSKGLNEFEVKALEITEQYLTAPAPARQAGAAGLSLGERPHDPANCDRAGRPHLGPCNSAEPTELGRAADREAGQ